MVLAATASLSAADYVVIAIYLAITLAIGVAIGSRLKTGDDFFLGGRRLPWWAIGMSLVATDIGATDIIGVGGAAYRHGLAVANFEWIGCIPAMIVAAFVFVPFFYRTGVTTIPEFLERRYNVAVRTVLATCWLLFMACNLGIMLLASAKMMTAVFGWNTATCLLVTAALVGTYTFVGGLAAVVYTDMLQCVVMIGGCCLLLVCGLVRVGGVAQLRDRLAQAEQADVAAQEGAEPAASQQRERPVRSRLEHTQLILPVDTPSPFPWTGIYFGLAWVLSPAYWIGNQAIIQRSLGARSAFEAQASYVWGALLKNVIPLIIAVPGLIAVAVLPELADGDQAIPRLVGELLPAGLRGMFVAAFLAALMSSIDSYLNSAATLVTNDLYVRFWRPDATGERLLQVGRWATLALVAWSVAFAGALTLLREGSAIYSLFQTLLAFFQGPALAVLLLGVLWPRATGAAAAAGLAAGIATSVALYALNQPVVYEALGWAPLFRIQEPFLYFSVWAFLVALSLTVVLSWLTPPPPAAAIAFVNAAWATTSEDVRDVRAVSPGSDEETSG